MAFENKAAEFSKEHIYYIEIDIDTCSLTSGAGACTATETGNDKCFNTFQSCNDKPNFDEVIQTLSFCSASSSGAFGLPVNGGFSTIPSVESVSITPSKIDLTGGLGIRASATVTFLDHPHSDIGLDKYLNDRTYIASETGSFWSKFRARNPYYKFRSIRVYTGYLDNGRFDINNMECHNFVIDSLTVDKGRCRIVGKDVLKLADNDKAQAPLPTTIELSTDISTSDTTLVVTNTTTVNLDDYIRIGAELMRVTGFDDDLNELYVRRAGDALNLYTSTLEEHSEGDSVQKCLEYVGQSPAVIANDLMTNYAGIDSSFIDYPQWESEINENAPTGLSTLITEPTGVNKLIKELGDSAATYFHWDEVANKIRLTTIKQPPVFDGFALDEDANILDKGITFKDDDSKRVGTVFFNYGMKDFTKNLDEQNNFDLTYVRADTDTITNYKSNKIKTIFSRWVTNDGRTAVVNAAARIGRRFSNTPRSAKFTLDAKDYNNNISNTVFISSKEITDFNGNNLPTAFQLLSRKVDKTRYHFEALEYSYGVALSQDEGVENPDTYLLQIANDRTDSYNIKQKLDEQFSNPTLDETKKVRVLILEGVKKGSSSVNTPAITTGTGFNGAEVIIENRSYIVGKGADRNTGGTPQNGGVAINLEYPITLDNTGIIGGGGGAGGSVDEAFDEYPDGTISGFAAGGGGAGFSVGVAGADSDADGDSRLPQDGTIEEGGEGGISTATYPDGDSSDYTFTIRAGRGGNLGQDGEVATDDGNGTSIITPPTLGGAAITKNGFAITNTNIGDIRGDIT